MKNKKISYNNKSSYKSIILIFTLICILIGAACFKYYTELQKTLKTESGEYLQEISKQIAVNASKTISNNFSVLGTISTVLQTSKTSTFEELLPITKDQQSHWNYQDILIVDENGIAYDSNGQAVKLENDDYLHTAIVNRERSMSPLQIVKEKECIVFITPLDNIVINGIKMSALATTYDLSTFDKILSMSAFDGKGYAHVIKKDGAAVIRSSSVSAVLSGYNILNSIADAKFYDNYNINKIRSDIAFDKDGQVEFTKNNESIYMAYTPLQAQEWSLVTFVPVSVVNAKSRLFLIFTLLICGFITVIFAILFGYLMFSSLRHKHKLEQIAYVDSVTSGHTVERFYELISNELNPENAFSFALIYTNIENFKLLNEQFGRDACDVILCAIENSISLNLSEKEYVCRIFADNFCVLIEYTNEAELTARFDKWYNDCILYIQKSGAVWLPLLLEFGVYRIGKEDIPFTNMIDRAKLALREAVGKTHGKMRFSIYDERIREHLIREKQIEDMMESALASNEFKVYLQPKYNTSDECIGGAEALVRWQHPTDGMIYPDEFIPLFERNGFIIELDLWVFEETCRTIRRWLDEDKIPIRISVNCSRIHLKNPSFLQKYCDVFKKYDIPSTYIELELTENVVFEDVEQLTQIIHDIHDAGFSCSMDDFGSGYSSLNLIKDIPVDVLKLDKIFFVNSSSDLKRTESIVLSIITMAKALSIETVAEGVEKREQVDMLKRLGCNYIQGFFFAKPMPISDFETLAFGNNSEQK